MRYVASKHFEYVKSLLLEKYPDRPLTCQYIAYNAYSNVICKLKDVFEYSCLRPSKAECLQAFNSLNLEEEVAKWDEAELVKKVEDDKTYRAQCEAKIATEKAAGTWRPMGQGWNERQRMSNNAVGACKAGLLPMFLIERANNITARKKLVRIARNYSQEFADYVAGLSKEQLKEQFVAREWHHFTWGRLFIKSDVGTLSGFEGDFRYYSPNYEKINGKNWKEIFGKNWKAIFGR